jgi:hypothetical protein
MLTIGSIVWGVRDVPRSPFSSSPSPDLVGESSGRSVLRMRAWHAEGRGMTSLIQVCNQAAEVERLLGLGARRVDWRYPEQADYVVLADPDGNTFCVVQK